MSEAIVTYDVQQGTLGRPDPQTPEAGVKTEAVSIYPPRLRFEPVDSTEAGDQS
jgi:hypothetical protein